MSKKYETVGGQAVIEGVMMKSVDRTAMAVRSDDGNIKYVCEDNKKITNPILKLPLIRGCVSFFKMFLEGIGFINKSAAMAFEDEEEESSMGWVSFLGIAAGILISIVLFIYLPTLAASFFRNVVDNRIVLNLIEGAIRIVIFIAYLLIINMFPDMKRFFMYHGAEHKTIMCSEKGLDLSIDNVRSSTRLHPRCGTTFMFLLMFISIIVYSLIIWSDGVVLRTLIRIALLPLIAGISYEVLKALAKTDNKCFYVFKWPGLMLQKITTKEPTDEMIEVAILAFKGAKLEKEAFDIWSKSEGSVGFTYYE